MERERGRAGEGDKKMGEGRGRGEGKAGMERGSRVRGGREGGRVQDFGEVIVTLEVAR